MSEDRKARHSASWASADLGDARGDAGIAIELATRRYLAANAPQLVAPFEDAVTRAAAEE